MPRKRNPKRRRPQARRKVKLRTLRNPRLRAEPRHQNSQVAHPPLRRNSSPSRQLALSYHLLSPRPNLLAEAIHQPLRPLPPEQGERKRDPLRSRIPQSRASQRASDKTPPKELLAPRCASVRMQQLIEKKLKKKRKKPEKRPKSGRKKQLKKRDRSDRLREARSYP